MTLFWTKFLTYIIIMIALLAIGLLGGFIGVQIRKAKDKHDAKKEAMTSASDNQ